MKKEQANKLYFLVNDKANMEAIEFYANSRIEDLKESLTKADTFEEVRRIQGSIDELKRLKKLRDEVNNPRD